MGGGHVSRPDFGMPQPDAAYPLTEFYLLAHRVSAACGSSGRGLDPAALPCPDAAFI